MRVLILSYLLSYATAFVSNSVRIVPPATPTSSLLQGPRSKIYLCTSNSQCRVVQSRKLTRWAAQTDAQTNEKEESLGVIICDHGSRRKEANDMLFEVAERYRSYTGCDTVEVGATLSSLSSFTAVTPRQDPMMTARRTKS